MKNKKDPDSGAADIRLPAVKDLALLAAIVGPADNPAAATERAMAFHIEAALFLRECHWKGDSLIMSYGSVHRKKEIEKACRQKAFQSLWGETLELRPQDDTDPVRQYLAERGLALKTASAVLRHLRQTFPDFEQWPEWREQLRNEKKFRVVPRHLLVIILEAYVMRQREAVRQHRQTTRSN